MLAERHGNDALLVRALTWGPGPIDRFRPALLRALARVPYLASWLPREQVDRLAAGDPTLPFLISSSAEVSVRNAGRAGAKGAGLPGFRWLEAELGRTQSAGDRDGIRRNAEAIVALDADNIPALLALDLLQADPRRLARAGMERPDTASTWLRDGRTLILLGRVLAEDPGDTHLRLLLAWRQLQSGLAEDARREAGKVAASPGASREARRAAGVVEALAGLDLGRGAAFVKWLASGGAARSRFVEDWVVNRFNRAPHLPDEVEQARRQVFRRVFVPTPPASDRAGLEWWAWTALKDTKMDPAIRQGTLDMIVAGRPGLAPVARSCAAERLPLEACARRIELASDLDRAAGNDDYDEEDWVEIDLAALPAALGTEAEIPAHWLASIARETGEKLAGLAPWLDKLRARPVARSQAFGRLDVLVRWANKDATGGARALARTPGLPRAERLALRLLAGDIASGLVAPALAPALAHPPPRWWTLSSGRRPPKNRSSGSPKASPGKIG